MITAQLKEPEKITAQVKPVTANSGGGIKQEVDPTVPDWAKQPEKPEYTADEVGAIPAAELPAAINAALAQAKESGEFDGDDYVLTDADKQEIAEMAAELVDAPEGGDYIPVPAIASIGQTIKVSAVDDSGKPTAWEAVDFPEGGGGDAWRLVADVRLTEDTATIEITQDTAGNAFALKEYLLYGKVVGAADNSTAGSLYVEALNNKGGKKRIGYASQSVPANGGKKAISVYGKVCGKRLRTIFGVDGDGQSNINAQMFTMSTVLDATFAQMEFEEIKNVSLSSNGAKYGATTYLELWGVDA